MFVAQLKAVPPSETWAGYRTQSPEELEAIAARSRELGRLADERARLASAPRPVKRDLTLPTPVRPPEPQPPTSPVTSLPARPPAILLAGEGVTSEAVLTQRPPVATLTTALPSVPAPAPATAPSPAAGERPALPWLWIVLVGAVVAFMVFKR